MDGPRGTIQVLLQRDMTMTGNTIRLAALATLSLLALASGSTRVESTVQVVDEPLMCPYCGGAFEPDRFALELTREAGVRGIFLALGVR